MGSASQPDVILSIESLCVKNRYLNATTYVMPGQVPVISTNNSTGFFNASPRSKERPGKKKNRMTIQPSVSRVTGELLWGRESQPT